MAASSASSSPLSSAPDSPAASEDASPSAVSEFNTQSLESASVAVAEVSSRKRKRTTTVAIAETATTSVVAENLATATTASKTTSATRTEKKPRRTKAQKEADEAAAMVPIAARAVTKTHFIGAHVSAAKGVQNAIHNSIHIGGNAFALFLKSQRKWTSSPLDPASITLFKAACKEHNYNPKAHLVPHGSYLVNLAQPDPAKAKQAYDCFVDDLKRCEQLGIGLYNFHPGSTLGEPRSEAILRIANHLNTAHTATSGVVTLLENMAGAGNVLGGQFEDLRDIISHIKDKSRVGVCLDTCHAFAAGHDLRTAATYAATMEKFDAIIGLKYLRALHINDSKAPLGSNRDLHANIGTGFLGLEAFRLLVNDERLHGVPMVLETPLENNDTSRWAEEIKLLEGMVGKGPEDILEDVERLQKLGENERNRVMEQVEKKIVKDKKAAEKGTAKKARKKKVEETDEEMEADAGEDAKSKRGRRKKVKKEEPDADEDEIQATPKSKPRRGRKKVKEETEDESGCESC